MRCPSCGTQNEPDSRFCGGCGARLSAGENRIAPTQKIDTGANEAQPIAQQLGAPLAPVIPHTPLGGPPAPIPVSQVHANVPQGLRDPGVQPGAQPAPPLTVSAPGAYAATPAPVPAPQAMPRASGQRSVPGAAAAARPPRSTPSFDAPRRQRWGLILAVLLVDLTLAAAGTWMLVEGLSAGGAAEPAEPAPESGPAPAQGGGGESGSAAGSAAEKTGEIAPKPLEPGPAGGSAAGEVATPGAIATTGAAAGEGSGDAAAAGAGSNDAATTTAAQRRKTAKKKTVKPPPGGGSGGPRGKPIDPYAEPDRPFGPPGPPGPPPPPPPPPR